MSNEEYINWYNTEQDFYLHKKDGSIATDEKCRELMKYFYEVLNLTALVGQYKPNTVFHVSHYETYTPILKEFKYPKNKIELQSFFEGLIGLLQYESLIYKDKTEQELIDSLLNKIE